MTTDAETFRIEPNFLTEPRPEENDWDFKIKIPQERGMQFQRLIDTLPSGSIIYLNHGIYTIPENTLVFRQDSPTVHIIGAPGRTTTIRGIGSVLEEDEIPNNNEWDREEN